MDHLCDSWNYQECWQESSIEKDGEPAVKHSTNKGSNGEIVCDCTRKPGGWYSVVACTSLTLWWLTGSGEIYWELKIKKGTFGLHDTWGMGAKLPPHESRERESSEIAKFQYQMENEGNHQTWLWGYMNFIVHRKWTLDGIVENSLL